MDAEMIRIDRSSIRKNENAGATVSFFGKKEAWVRFWPNGPVAGARHLQGGIWELRGERLGELLSKVTGEVTETWEAEHRYAVKHPPIAEYSFTYIPTPLVCESCGETFMHNEQGEGWHSCPHCGKEDCCLMVWEKIEDVLGIKGS